MWASLVPVKKPGSVCRVRVTQNTLQVSAISLECCPPSAWNTVRHHAGTLSAISVESCPPSRGIRSLPTVQHGKRFIAKLTQSRARCHHRRSSLRKKLPALGKACGVGNDQRRQVIEVTTGQGGQGDKERQRENKCGATGRNSHRIWCSKKAGDLNTTWMQKPLDTLARMGEKMRVDAHDQ